jgi:hypothetical protein
MVAACAATMKRMPTKNLEMNMAMLVVVVCGGLWWWCFDWVVDVLERNPSSILYLLSHFLRAREATAYCILPGLPFVSLLSSPLSLDAQSQFTPYPHTFRHFNSHLAGNPISSRPFHFPRALVDVRASIHLALPLAAPVRSRSSLIILSVVSFIVFSSRQEYMLVPLSAGPRLRCHWLAQ